MKNPYRKGPVVSAAESKQGSLTNIIRMARKAGRMKKIRRRPTKDGVYSKGRNGKDVGEDPILKYFYAKYQLLKKLNK